MSLDLHAIKDPKVIKPLSIKELEVLSQDIREFLIAQLAKTGGHLSSNLGIVELTLALHKVFDSPTDQLIFDVGHQAYTHKILTGRANQFDTLRQLDGLSGYIKRSESEHDLWESGHAGTSISALAGFLYAKKIKQEPGKVIAVIGDASITNGMAFEALNQLGSSGLAPIIILNDNKMGISKSVGAISGLLTTLRANVVLRKTKSVMRKTLPSVFIAVLRRFRRAVFGFFQRVNLFEDLGYMYLGPVDGNDIKALLKVLNKAKRLNKPCVIHVITEKGKGYHSAEKDEHGTFHGVAPFDLETGKTLKNGEKFHVSWSEVISEGLIALRDTKPFHVIMPAMIVGAKFERFQTRYPSDITDIGIAEEHGASMAAAMALSGVNVFFPVYSTFSQRAYDQILNDIVRQKAPVVLGIDRAGIVGEDGSTHQGIFDIPMFNAMPDMVIASPHTAQEAFNMLKFAFEIKRPIAIRYPRGTTYFDKSKPIAFETMDFSWEVLQEGKDVTIIASGPSLNLIMRAIKASTLSIKVINARFIKPLDKAMIQSIVNDNQPVLVYEESTLTGGLYSSILIELQKHRFTFASDYMALDNAIVDHGDYKGVLKRVGLDEEAFLKKVAVLYETR